jgi:hypothetical protein
MNDQSNRLPAVVSAVAIVAVVVGIVAAGWWLQADSRTPADKAPATSPATVKVDHDYYFFVRLVEFKPLNPKGKTWDSGNSSAPDAEIIIYWRGNRTFSWAERKDQLINTWDLFRVNVKDLVLSGGEIDIATAINAPLLRVVPNESVTIEVWDDDPAFSDLALKMEIPLAQLREGRNTIVPPESSGIARIEIDMLDRETPLARLIEIQSNGG